MGMKTMKLAALLLALPQAGAAQIDGR